MYSVLGAFTHLRKYMVTAMCSVLVYGSVPWEAFVSFVIVLFSSAAFLQMPLVRDQVLH